MIKICLNILLPTILAIYAYKRQKINLSGTIAAWLFTILIIFIGNWQSFSLVLMTFISTIITSRFKHKNDVSNIVEKAKTKDIIQILANLFLPTLSIIFYGVFKNHLFLLCFICTIGESLSDSLASEIGILSKKNPINILTLKRVERGLSGGLSFLGTFASICGSFIVALFSYYFYNITLKHAILIIGIIFTGTIIDSVLGATIQSKYKCLKCNFITEKTTHCNYEAKLISGFKFINNDGVNFLTNLTTLIITIIVFS